MRKEGELLALLSDRIYITFSQKVLSCLMTLPEVAKQRWTETHLTHQAFLAAKVPAFAPGKASSVCRR